MIERYFSAPCLLIKKHFAGRHFGEMLFWKCLCFEIRWNASNSLCCVGHMPVGKMLFWLKDAEPPFYTNLFFWAKTTRLFFKDKEERFDDKGKSFRSEIFYSAFQYNITWYPIVMTRYQQNLVSPTQQQQQQHTHTHTWAHTDTHIHICVCMCAFVHVCMCACVHVCMCLCVYVFMCTCVHVCMCACVHV